MKGMILAAGYGTRLAAKDGDPPKPLVEAGGRPMIAWAIDALTHAGCTELVINLHHRARQIEEYLGRGDVSVPVHTVHEASILGTGGGVLNAREMLDGDEPFFLYNADIYTDQDLRPMWEAHVRSGAFATLMVNRRVTSRALLFDSDMHFLGKEQWRNEGMSFPDEAPRRGFCGIHIIDPGLFRIDHPHGFSDIFDIYRVALEKGYGVRGFETDAYWTDLGTPERIAAFNAWRAAHSGSNLQG